MNAKEEISRFMTELANLGIALSAAEETIRRASERPGEAARLLAAYVATIRERPGAWWAEEMTARDVMNQRLRTRVAHLENKLADLTAPSGLLAEDKVNLSATPRPLAAVLAQAREALRWLVNIGHGTSKGGDETSPPSTLEVHAAIRAGDVAITAIDACSAADLAAYREPEREPLPAAVDEVASWLRRLSRHDFSQRSVSVHPGKLADMADRLEAAAPAVAESASAFLARESSSLRAAGGKLAEAALYVVREYDGLHRLARAVAGWSNTVADEGGRGAAAWNRQSVSAPPPPLDREALGRANFVGFNGKDTYDDMILTYRERWMLGAEAVARLVQAPTGGLCARALREAVRILDGLVSKFGELHDAEQPLRSNLINLIGTTLEDIKRTARSALAESPAADTSTARPEQELAELRRLLPAASRHHNLVTLAAASLAGLRAHPGGYGDSGESLGIAKTALIDATHALAAIEAHEAAEKEKETP